MSSFKFKSRAIPKTANGLKRVTHAESDKAVHFGDSDEAGSDDDGQQLAKRRYVDVIGDEDEERPATTVKQNRTEGERAAQGEIEEGDKKPKSQIVQLIEKRKALHSEAEPLDETEAFKRDIEACPDVTLDSYHKVSIEDFGKSLLKSMGWREDQEEKTQVREIRMRQPRLGLGATPLPPEEAKKKRQRDRRRLANSANGAKMRNESSNSLPEKSEIDSRRNHPDYSSSTNTKGGREGYRAERRERDEKPRQDRDTSDRSAKRHRDSYSNGHEREPDYHERDDHLRGRGERDRRDRGSRDSGLGQRDRERGSRDYRSSSHRDESDRYSNRDHDYESSRKYRRRDDADDRPRSRSYSHRPGGRHDRI